MSKLTEKQRETYKTNRGITIADNISRACKNCFHYTRAGICAVHYVKTKKCNTCKNYKKQ